MKPGVATYFLPAGCVIRADWFRNGGSFAMKAGWEKRRGRGSETVLNVQLSHAVMVVEFCWRLVFMGLRGFVIDRRLAKCVKRASTRLPWHVAFVSAESEKSTCLCSCMSKIHVLLRV